MFGFLKRRRPFDYPGIEPPFPFVPFDQMTDAEAQRQFHWFVGESGNRRRLLLDLIRATNGKVSECDYTPASLVPLWESVAPFFEEREMTPDENDAFIESTPVAARQLDIKRTELTTATRCLAIDIGFYLAEVFIRRHPTVHWQLWTKCGEGEPTKRPVLSGFKLPLVPVDLVIGSIWKHLDSPGKTRLLDVYKVWEADLEDAH